MCLSNTFHAGYAKGMSCKRSTPLISTFDFAANEKLGAPSLSQRKYFSAIPSLYSSERREIYGLEACPHDQLSMRGAEPLINARDRRLEACPHVHDAQSRSPTPVTVVSSLANTPRHLSPAFSTLRCVIQAVKQTHFTCRRVGCKIVIANRRSEAGSSTRLPHSWLAPR
jgi:hypothetical protein